MGDLFGDKATKRCKGCHAVKPHGDFHAPPSKTGKRYVHTYCKVCHAEQTKVWRRSRRGVAKTRDAIRLRVYGVTPEQYATMLLAQNGVCAICQRPERHRHHCTGEVRQLVVDHCHRTGRVRGLLCSLCNRAVALFDDDPLRLRAAAAYVEAQEG